MDYKHLLQKRHVELIEYIRSVKESARPVNLNDPIGRLSRMDAIQQQQVALNNLKQAEISLRLLMDAMTRLEKGEYGNCLNCDEPITLKRLIAKPETPSCTSCQDGHGSEDE